MKKVISIILVIILLALCYTGGYFLGRKAGEAEEARKAEEKVIEEVEEKTVEETAEKAESTVEENKTDGERPVNVEEDNKELVSRLFKAWMEENNKTQGKDAFEEIRIDKVTMEEDKERIDMFFSEEEVPENYILAWVEYSLKVPSEKSPYMAGNGEYKDGWIVEKENYVYIVDDEVKDVGTGF